MRGTPEQVWAVLTDFAKCRDWNPFIREASGEARTGARLKVRIHPPEASPMSFRPIVREASPGRQLRWLGRRRARFEQSEEFRGILVPLFPNAMYAKIQRGFEAMNHVLEARVEPTLWIGR